MTEKAFNETSIAWRELNAHCRNPNWVFRGMANSTWKLETSLERSCKAIYGSLERARNLEKTLLREFQRRFYHYSSIIPPFDDFLQWFSLMQHHGAPTRLLDWTYSRYIAAYFALEAATEQNKECAVWAINTMWVNDQGERILRKNSLSGEFLFKQVDEKVEKHFREAFFPKSQEVVSTVIPINPFQINERLTLQKGVFLCPGNSQGTFEDNLRELPGYDDKRNVQKLKINVSERLEALRELHDMNINRATLFPGLEGFAQSLKIYHPAIDVPDRIPPSPGGRH